MGSSLRTSGNNYDWLKRFESTSSELKVPDGLFQYKHSIADTIRKIFASNDPLPEGFRPTMSLADYAENPTLRIGLMEFAEAGDPLGFQIMPREFNFSPFGEPTEQEIQMIQIYYQFFITPLYFNGVKSLIGLMDDERLIANSDGKYYKLYKKLFESITVQDDDRVQKDKFTFVDEVKFYERDFDEFLLYYHALTVDEYDPEDEAFLRISQIHPQHLVGFSDFVIDGDVELKRFLEHCNQFKGLKSLEIIDDSDQLWASWFSFKLPCLEKLELQKTSLKSFEVFIQLFPNIVELILPKGLTDLPPWIASLLSLKKLAVFQHKLKDWEIEKLKQALPQCEIVYTPYITHSYF